MSKLRIALAGNPNAGKSTVFNALTGGDQHTGNWPGKTVELKTGCFQYQGHEIEVIDLPGTYSLSSYSPEEEITRNYLVQEKPDLVINIVDAANLERNLYLTLQILETGAPTILFLNMSDVAQRRGHSFDLERLSVRLKGVPVVSGTASKNQGIEALKQAILEHQKIENKLKVAYPNLISTHISAMVAAIQADPSLNGDYDHHWLALQLLEGDTSLLNDPDSRAIKKLKEIEAAYSGEIDMAIADHRYQVIQDIAKEVVTKVKEKTSFTDKVDRIVTHRWLGVPVFLASMYLVFNLVQNVSAPYLDWIDGFFSGPLTHWTQALMTWLHAPAWLTSLLIDGVVAGVGGVLVFLPGLFVMYFLLAVMEQSGYLARAAFVMDRFMSKAGLHGKSFIPMILGFGCNVPAIYATRTIEKREARILTGLLIPFMSCSARLPVYLIFGLAFFPQHANLVIFSLYLLGIVVAAGIGLLLSRLLFRGETVSILVMELPDYHLPTLKSLLRYAKSQSGAFVKNAGTLIVAFSTILWFLLNLPWGVQDARQSYFGVVSAGVAPVLAPAGFDTWEASGSLVTGLVAKEVVVSTLAQIYHLPQEGTETQHVPVIEELKEQGLGLWKATLNAGEEFLEVLTPGITLFGEDEAGEDLALSRALRGSFTPLSAYAFLVFVLLYVPCAATIGAQRAEFGWKWTAVSVGITLIVPWVLSVLVYQGGTLLGFG